VHCQFPLVGLGLASALALILHIALAHGGAKCHGRHWEGIFALDVSMAW